MSINYPWIEKYRPKYLNDIKPSAISNYNRNHGID